MNGSVRSLHAYHISRHVFNFSFRSYIHTNIKNPIRVSLALGFRSFVHYKILNRFALSSFANCLNVINFNLIFVIFIFFYWDNWLINYLKNSGIYSGIPIKTYYSLFIENQSSYVWLYKRQNFVCFFLITRTFTQRGRMQ